MNTSHIPWEKYKAILFDMDGVIVDSESIWPKKQPKMIAKILPDFPLQKAHIFMGKSAKGVFKILKSHGLTLSEKEFIAQLDDFALKEIYPNASVFPDIINLIHEKNKTHTLAVASSALHSWISCVLDTHDIRKYFDAVISSEDVEGASKPDPDVFLKAAEELGMKPSECLVIEDSPNGILAAKNAGMDCVVFKSHSNANKDCSLADFVIE